MTVPLSDHEQRILDEIEKSLYQEDPSFARQVKQKGGPEGDRRRGRLGAVAFVAGFIGLFLFFYSRMVVVGVLAFAGMVLGIVLIAGSLRNSVGATSESPSDRISRAFTDWEQRVRNRYKKD